MAIVTMIERIVSDQEPDGLSFVRVAWADDHPPYLILTQDEDAIHLRREHAAELAAAITAALSDPS
ncbi:hypothetical protein [Sphingomonas sp.]|uniref:hypothetical protein n=1 Tax=Sphingomonas sp. TaxID=28214 RepID=UPI0025EE258D|nr:hypothetical protein [Sphingomonas sp.]